GAFELRGAALFVIRQSQAQRRYAEAVEYPTGLDMAVRLGVPLRPNQNSGAWFVLSFATRREQPRAGYIVLCRRSCDGARPRQDLIVKFVIRNFGQLVKPFTGGHRLLSMASENRARIVPVN